MQLASTNLYTINPGAINLNVRIICSDCKEDPPNLVEEFSSGDTVCGSCGLVVGDRIVDTRSEWRTFANDEGGDNQSRVGTSANPLLNGSQLDTIISTQDGGHGLSKTQGRSVAQKGEKNLVSAYREISAMCDAIHLPKSISDIAKQVFKKVDDSKALKGRSNESIISACIFIACRQGKAPRTFKEICALTNVPKKEIGRVFKSLQKMLTDDNLLSSNAGQGDDSYIPSSTSPKDLMIRFCNRLSLPTSVQIAASELANRASAEGTLAGRSPISIAASGIYMASYLFQHPKLPREIAEVVGVSDSTIRNAYKSLYLEREKLIDPKWLNGKSMDMILPRP
ncbi:transcription initiation factor IIB [Pneumocystis murina B123]|uniref:Transcription initiation factor IIB n=1 Tax=Pneumocystis murina (strain B123) TaxID=1069680 RepID=M7NQ64_PNEMU|nr:transcription initiation factor IIB [Pneumocystis murina B123]EMR10843.1 transcription initiation factor IIB [Pneumocystis murina B123]